MSMEIVAIIPARGGSKGIPKKNLRVLAGRPLVAHSIECALHARSVNRVVVSTDDADIATVSTQCGAQVVHRPGEISGDTASSEAALLHALEQLQRVEAYKPDLLVFLQCTSPLTLPQDIDDAVKTFQENKADSLVAVTPFHYFLWRAEKDSEIVGINHDKRQRVPRQQRQDQYLETGAFYVMNVDGFRTAKHRFFGKTIMHVMPPDRVLEIDEPADLELAELRLRLRTQQDIARHLPRPVRAIIFDFDGVFTDNRVTVFQDGSEAVRCDRSDGYGIEQMKAAGIPMLVLSKERNPVVAARCTKLNIPYAQGVDNKAVYLSSWLHMRNIPAAQVVYVGNDVNDLECMTHVGCGVAVADAHPRVKQVARVVLTQSGGRGAVRELTDLIQQTIKGGEHG